MTAKQVRELLKRTGCTLRELGESLNPPRHERTVWTWKTKGCYSKGSVRQLERMLEEARRAKAS
jgi:hypothetical protein